MELVGFSSCKSKQAKRWISYDFSTRIAASFTPFSVISHPVDRRNKQSIFLRSMIERLKGVLEDPAEVRQNGTEDVVSKTTLCYAVMPTKLMLPIHASKP
jgi:hypothetical protein